MGTPQHTVFVGAGQAAGECAMRLRRNGYAGAITVIGEEASGPYQRPPLSKGMLSGEMASPAELLLRPDAAYAENAVTLRTGTRVAAVDRARRVVRLDDGEEIGWSTLVFATGGRARRLACPGATLEGVYALRTIADADALREALRPGAALLVVGGGYIGLEVAAVARARGLAVTLCEAAPRLLARVAPPALSAHVADRHRAEDVRIELGVGVERLEPAANAPGRVGAALLGDGRRVAADLVLVGVGLEPATELAAAAGLAVENGIVADANCRSVTDPAIFAIGDCARVMNSFLGRQVRLESVPNAADHARIAADTIAGRPVAPVAAPWFWSDQYDLRLQSVGLREGEVETVLRGDPAAGSFLLVHLQDSVVVAADAVNRAAEFMAARRLVGMRARMDPARIADVGAKLQAEA